MVLNHHLKKPKILNLVTAYAMINCFDDVIIAPIVPGLKEIEAKKIDGIHLSFLQV